MTPMEEYLGLVAQYGFPMVMCLLFYFDMRTMIKSLAAKLDQHLINHS